MLRKRDNDVCAVAGGEVLLLTLLSGTGLPCEVQAYSVKFEERREMQVSGLRLIFTL